ncbi:MAG TPA: M28 family peptidase, partial [Gemmatimonadaceae bacterium]|nr:M28 family peptidase [Gemmatimonadaceae bacterium]
MRQYLLLSLVLLGACRPASGVSALRGADSTSLRRDVSYLASDALEGRRTGTAGNDSAAAYIARRFAALGLRAFAPGYLQRFDARPARNPHAEAQDSILPTQNVVGWLPGSDPVLRNEYVVIGAHFDHLGHSPQFAQDPEAKDAIRNGADDNASGTATILELARLLARNPPKRPVIFVAFSGEEYGLLGSSYFVKNAPVPMSQVVAMLNFDMVGRLSGEKLLVYGSATAKEFPAILDSANVATRFTLAGGGDGFGSSDHASFYGADVPVLHFFTDLHDDYHRATDDAEKINAAGMARVVTLAEGVARRVADLPARMVVVRSAAPPRSTGAGNGAYFGSIPDMGATDVKGMRLTGVRAGSPADQGGVKGGDVIVEFGGRPVTDIYSYTEAINAYKPGDTVKVVVLRGSERVTLTVTLGRRGG